MVSASTLALICLTTIAPWGEDSKPQAASPERSAAYQEMKAKSGRNADAQVKLALWCEAHDMNAERIRHLTLATLIDPDHATARGLLGLVSYQGKWQRPDEVSRQLADDTARKALIQQYLDHRVRMRDDADGHWEMALWCAKNGLETQSISHLYQVIRHAPKRAAAYARLRYKKQGSRWMRPGQIEAEKAELEAQAEANKFWKPRIEKLRNAVESRSEDRRARAEEELAAIDDPRAVPMIWAVLSNGGKESHQRLTIQTLTQIDAPGATRAIAMMGVFSPYPDVRKSTIEILRRRDPREFASLLVGMIREPIKYQAKPTTKLGESSTLHVERKTKSLTRSYVPVMPPQQNPYAALGADDFNLLMTGQAFGSNGLTQLPIMPGTTPVDPQKIGNLLEQGGLSQAQSAQLGQSLTQSAQTYSQHLPDRLQTLYFATYPYNQAMANAQREAAFAQRVLQADVQAIEEYNAPITLTNGRVRGTLKELSGKDLGDDPDEWRGWLADLEGYAYRSLTTPTPRETIFETVNVTEMMSNSCFGAGTLVHTIDGLRAIETINAGDTVLTQDTETGAMSYHSVVTAYHNPPAATYRIDVGSESIVATGIHRFWKAGKGWVMARELAAGDSMRTNRGVQSVKAVSKDQVQPVFNLQIADANTFLVGEQGVLVHDNSLITPVEKPFDGLPALGSAENQSASRR